jgi:bacterioferritin-associated ferredoxin
MPIHPPLEAALLLKMQYSHGHISAALSSSSLGVRDQRRTVMTLNSSPNHSRKPVRQSDIARAESMGTQKPCGGNCGACKCFMSQERPVTESKQAEQQAGRTAEQDLLRIAQKLEHLQALVVSARNERERAAFLDNFNLVE